MRNKRADPRDRQKTPWGIRRSADRLRRRTRCDQ